MAIVRHGFTEQIPNKMFVTALSDINKGDEITISYEPMIMGFVTPDRTHDYATSILGFECKCGHCAEAPVPFGYKKGDSPKEHKAAVTELIRSFCCEPPGTQRLAIAQELFADHSGLFMAGNPEYDIVVAYLVSAGVLECVHESSGLGLSIVHGLVTLHNASIKIESEPLKGTKVTIFFPKDFKTENIVSEEILLN